MSVTTVSVGADPGEQMDRLVAAYSAIGRTRRRRRNRGRKLAVSMLLTLPAAIWVAVQSGVSLSPFDLFEQGELTSLRELVRSELGKLSAQRQDFDMQRAWYDTRARELEVRLAEFDERYAGLQAQRDELATQSALLADAMAQIDEQRDALLSARTGDSSYENEIAAIGTERRALEQRWQEFASESSSLASELELLERQRRTLESERVDVNRERVELESLLEAGRGEGRDRGTPVPFEATTLVLPSIVPEIPSDLEFWSGEQFVMATDAVGVDRLADMRGGIMIGGGMNIAVGLTRMASLNGESRYSESVQLSGLSDGLDAAALGDVNQFVIQNGPGNWISPAAIQGGLGGFGTVIQNSLDNQTIGTTMIYDVKIQDVSNAVKGLTASQALTDSLGFHQ